MAWPCPRCRHRPVSGRRSPGQLARSRWANRHCCIGQSGGRLGGHRLRPLSALVAGGGARPKRVRAKCCCEGIPGGLQRHRVHREVDPAPIVKVAVLAQEASLTQLAEVVGDKVLGKVQFLGELAVATLPSHDQQEDPASSRIRQQPQEIGGSRLDVAGRAHPRRSAHTRRPNIAADGGVRCGASTEITSMLIDAILALPGRWGQGRRPRMPGPKDPPSAKDPCSATGSRLRDKAEARLATTSRRSRWVGSDPNRSRWAGRRSSVLLGRSFGRSAPYLHWVKLVA